MGHFTSVILGNTTELYRPWPEQVASACDNVTAYTCVRLGLFSLQDHIPKIVNKVPASKLSCCVSHWFFNRKSKLLYRDDNEYFSWSLIGKPMGFITSGIQWIPPGFYSSRFKHEGLKYIIRTACIICQLLHYYSMVRYRMYTLFAEKWQNKVTYILKILHEVECCEWRENRDFWEMLFNNISKRKYT